MFYPVKVIDHQGRVKKYVSSKQLSQRYWKAFYKEMRSEKTSKAGKVKLQKQFNKPLEIANIPISSN